MALLIGTDDGLYRAADLPPGATRRRGRGRRHPAQSRRRADVARPARHHRRRRPSGPPDIRGRLAGDHGDLDHNLENLGMGHAVGEGGLWRTTDAGDSWTRIDRGNDFSYIRRVFVHDGTLFFCGGEEAPPAWVEDEHDAVLFESTNFGRDYERVSYPGEPHEVIETWAVYDGDVICGSGLFDVPDQRDDVEGRIMRRDDAGEYHTVGRVGANVSRIEPLEAA